MAIFAAAIDPSPERRADFTERAQRELTAFYGSPAKVFERGDLCVVSWTAAWEPFRHAESAEATSFVWGYAMESGQSAPSQADLTQLWRSLPDRMPPPLEGIHAALSYRADGTWIAGSDLFGLMPVYYTSGKDYVVVSSSPELFRSHPAFVAELDPAGLAGILMTNGLVGGRALLRGVRRLNPGALLIAPQRGEPREIVQYRPQMCDRYFGDTFEANYQRVAETLDECFARHVNPHGSYGLVLSGGLDSRLVAGIMKRRGVDFQAFTFGSPRDIEAQCARAVADALPVRQRLLPIRMEQYVEYAHSECKWKHLSNGFSGITGQEPIADADQFPDGLLSGYVKEAVIGSLQATFGGIQEAHEVSFGIVYQKTNRWGFDIPAIKRLLAGSCAANVVDQVRDELEESYRSCAESEWQRAWLFGHYFRGRFHTSTVLGMHARWPWPVVPYIDTKMLDLMAGMPYAHVRGRRMQHHMLKTEFPDLARAPLDRTSFDMRPPVARYGRVVNRLLWKPREYYYRWTSGICERRYYRRTFDFNSAGWNAVRAAAEPYRRKALQVLDETALGEILPRPGERRGAAVGGAEDTAKAKLLTGFLMWSAAYL